MSKIVIGNQKMYMNKEDVQVFVQMLKETDLSNKEVIVCPSYPFLEYYNDVVPVGAQDVSINDNGAFTGQVSASQLKSLDIPYAIVGHSERREYNNENDEEINVKIKKLLEKDITPILCIGEKLEERQNKSTEIVIKNELTGDLKDLSPEFVEKIIIAYEPIWAIGTGLTPTLEEINDAMNFIKDYVSTTYNVEKTTILYGGSVSDKNIDELNTVSSIDGYLIGGASSKPQAFKYIIDSQNFLK